MLVLYKRHWSSLLKMSQLGGKQYDEDGLSSGRNILTELCERSLVRTGMSEERCRLPHHHPP